MRLALNIGEVKDRVVGLNFDVIRRFFLSFAFANFEGKFVAVSFSSGNPTIQMTPNPLGFVPTDWIPLAQVPSQTGATLMLERCTAQQLAWFVNTAPVATRAFVGRYRSSL